MGITNEQEHRGVTVQQGGVKVREGRGGCFQIRCSLISALNLSMGFLSFVVRIQKIFVLLSELLTQSLICS